MKLKLLLLIGSALAGAAVHAQWQPPIGIPMPPIGINETHMMYAGGAGYADAGNGPYTVYVDNGSGACSNSGAGTQAEPRCAIPTSLAAGDVVEVHGGPYHYQQDVTISASGTAADPAFIRGVDDGAGYPVIYDSDDVVHFGGSYMIIENLIFDRSQLIIRGSNIAARNVEQKNHPNKNGTELGGTGIVLYQSHIHHNQGDDRHGVHVGSNTDGVWVLENLIHHNGGDGIQFCHGCTTNPPTNVYIGRNEFHSDRENAVDLKYSSNVVVSQNTMYAYRNAPANTTWCFDDNSKCASYSSGSDGAAIVVGSDGGPHNVWVLFNDVSDGPIGVRVEEGYDTFVIGNRLHNLTGRGGIVLEKTGQPLVIAYNTIYNATKGIDQYWRENFTLFVQNNIFAKLSGDYINFDSGNVAAAATVENNLFWNDGGAIRLTVNNTQLVSNANQLNNVLRGTGNIIADPQLVGPDTGNFRPIAASAAIDAGNAALTTYDNVYRQSFPGMTILRDADGKNRPLDGNGGGNLKFDIGAYEFGGGVPPMPPMALTAH